MTSLFRYCTNEMYWVPNSEDDSHLGSGSCFFAVRSQHAAITQELKEAKKV